MTHIAVLVIASFVLYLAVNAKLAVACAFVALLVGIAMVIT